MAREFKLPDIGEGVHEGEVVKWFVKEGDPIRENDPVVEVMTDKVTVQIPSPVTGKVLQLRAKEGEVVKVGARSEEHTSELQSPCNLVCRLLLEKKKNEK